VTTSTPTSERSLHPGLPSTTRPARYTKTRLACRSNPPPTLHRPFPVRWSARWTLPPTRPSSHPLQLLQKTHQLWSQHQHHTGPSKHSVYPEIVRPASTTPAKLIIRPAPEQGLQDSPTVTLSLDTVGPADTNSARRIMWPGRTTRTAMLTGLDTTSTWIKNGWRS
jgi:hypothetical protein